MAKDSANRATIAVVKLAGLLVVAILAAGCGAPSSGATAALEKPTDLPADWTWHEIEGENCGFAVPSDWKVMSIKEGQDLAPSTKGSMHDIVRSLAVNALAMNIVTRDRGSMVVAADPYAAAVMVTHRKEDTNVSLEDAQARAAQQMASHTMKSETAPTGATATFPAGESKVINGELSGTSAGQPELRLGAQHFIFADGEDRYDIYVLSTSIDGSPLPDSEKIAQSFRFVRKK